MTSINLPGFRLTIVGAVGAATILGLIEVAWIGDSVSVSLASAGA